MKRRRRISLADWNSYKKAKSTAYRRQCELSLARMDKIKKHHLTKIIHYPKHKDAFDYVDEKFPEVGVKDVIIYECDKEYLCKIGLKGIGGCYNHVCQTIVVSNDLVVIPCVKDKDTWGSVVAKVSQDEVIVHELLHYVSLYKKVSRSINLEEEFAYGKSIEYLRNKGQTDDEIVNNTFLPFFITAVDSKKIFVRVLVENGYDIEECKLKSNEQIDRIVKKLDKELFEATKKDAVEMANLLITVNDAEHIDFTTIPIDDGSSEKFGLMDFK